MTKALEFLKKQPLLTAVIAAVLADRAIQLPSYAYWDTFLMRLVLCVAMLFFLYLISGEKTLSQGNNQTGYVFKHLLGFLIFALVLGGIGAYSTVRDGIAVEGLPVRLIVLLLMFLFGCLFEELCYRAILNDAIVRQFRNTKGVFVISAVVTSLGFGAVHVIGTSVTTGTEFAQAVLKTLSSAVIGFAFLILYWKTRNVWAVGLVHGLYDFLAAMAKVFLPGMSFDSEGYVLSGDVGYAGIILYSIQLLVGVLLVLNIWKKVGKTIDFKAMRENW